MSANTTDSKLPTHKNLKDRIAALQRLKEQNNSPPTSPNLNTTSSSPDPSLSSTHPNSNGNNSTKSSLRDKIARFEAAGGSPPIPRDSFGMGSMSHHEDDISRRKGEMLGNRVPGLNKPHVSPVDGLGMVSKSHLTVKPIAKGSVLRHGRGESQSLGSNHRRFISYSTLTSPSLSAYDGEGEAGLLEVDEFGGLNGLDRPQTSFSHYSPTLTPPTLPSPKVTAIDRLPGQFTIPDKPQRRVVSDSRASYGITRALTPDPEILSRLLEEEATLSSANHASRSQVEAKSIPDAQIRNDPKEPEVQPPTEPTHGLQTSAPDASPPSPTDPPYQATVEVVSETTSESVPVVDTIQEGAPEDDRRSVEIDPPVQREDHDPASRVSTSNPIPFPFSSLMDTPDSPPRMTSNVSTPSTPTTVVGTLPVIEKFEQPTEPVPSPEVARESDDLPKPEEPPVPPTLLFPPLPINTPSIEVASSELQTPPESPRPASTASTSTSDLSDSGFNYQSGSGHPDPDHDLFVLPLPKDDELPHRPIHKPVAVPKSMYQVFAPPQPPIDFPTIAAISVPTQPSDPNVSFTGDESLALDASQAEIVIAQSEVIRPASRTLVIAVPPPSPTIAAFRVRTPPPREESTLSSDAQASPPRIRKKLYGTHSNIYHLPQLGLSPPPTRQSFSAVVHQRTRTPNVPVRVDSLSPKSFGPVNTTVTPKRKESSNVEPLTPVSSGSELAFLAKNAAILEARLERGDPSEDLNRLNPVNQSVSFFTEPPRSMPRSGVKSASTPTLVPSLATAFVPPVPELVYDDGSSNSGFSSTPQIPSFLPQSRSRRSGGHEEADRKSLAPSHKSRKSEKSSKDKDPIPRARKLSARLRSLANMSTNSLKSLGRPSLSSETSISFDSPATVSIEPMTPPGSGEDGRLGAGIGIGSPGSRSQLSQGSGSEWGSPPRRRDMLGRASSFVKNRVERVRSGFLENSQGPVSSDYLSPMRAKTVSNRKVSHESQRGTSTKEYRGVASRATSPPRLDIPFLRREDTTRTPPRNSGSAGYSSGNSGGVPPIPLTPSTMDSSSFEVTELFDAFPSVPQNLPSGVGPSLLSGFELGTDPALGNRGRLGKGDTVPSSYRSRPSESY